MSATRAVTIEECYAPATRDISLWIEVSQRLKLSGGALRGRCQEGPEVSSDE